MTATLLAPVAVLVAVGVADAVAGSWRLLLRPTTPRAVAAALLGRAGAASAGGLLWATVAVMAWGTGYSPVPTAAVTAAATAALALWPLVFSVVGRLPVVGTPLLVLVHVATVAHVVAATPPGADGSLVWVAAAAGYLAFATCRVVAAPPSSADVGGLRHAR
jgi:hypothetical protein